MKIISVIAVLSFAVLIIINPELCASGAAQGLLLSGRVLIPSLFPMTVCTMFIMGSGAFSGLKRVSHVTQKLFHLSSDEFITVILSLIGGYPVGAKLLNEAVREKRISAEKAGLMLCYCVNSGPAFAVSAVGAYIKHYSLRFPYLKYAALLLEVTNAVAGTRSLPLTAFLLGFACIGIWCQLLSVGRLIKIRPLLFLICRIFHGILSVLLLQMIMKIFKITVQAAAAANFVPTCDGAALSVSMLTMVIIFIISVGTKKNTGKLLDDIV